MIRYSILSIALFLIGCAAPPPVVAQPSVPLSSIHRVNRPENKKPDAPPSLDKQLDDIGEETRSLRDRLALPPVVPQDSE